MADVETQVRKECSTCARYVSTGHIRLTCEGKCPECGKSYLNDPNTEVFREDDAHGTLDKLTALVPAIRYALDCSNPLLLPMLLDELGGLCRLLNAVYNLPTGGHEAVDA